MKIADATVWQVAAGNRDRSYPDVFLNWDVICIGSGGKVIEKFYNKMTERDIVVLHVGTAYVYGVGQVVGDSCSNDHFGDVDGWDLRFIRRVHWLWDYRRDNNGNPQKFKTYAMNRGDTVQPLKEKTSVGVRKWIDGLEITPEKSHRTLVSIPDGEPKPIEVSKVADYLFDRGVAADSINALTEHIGELQRIASWYDRSGTLPSESETVSYLVVPLLRALGWTPQRMAIEWSVKGGRIDIALFSRLPRDDKNLSVVVEAKKLDNACLAAKPQAQRLSDQSGRDECRRLIVTDGIRYGVYVEDNKGSFSDVPTAYVNINRMMDSYPILGCPGVECLGAAEGLRLISSDWSGEATEQTVRE